MIDLFESLLQWLYPAPLHCLECDRELQGWEAGLGLCSLCLQQLRFFSGEPLETTGGLAVQYVDQVQGVALYDGRIKEWIQRIKYYGERRWVEPLVELIIRQGVAGRWDGIVPVPLHAERMMERGYNQALLIAEGVAFYLGIPCCDWLERVKATLPQHHLNPGEREENLRGAFTVRKGVEVKGKDWLLLDDIFTTGTTVNEAARVLKAAGAKRVGVYVIASGRMM